jgi:hypothetical protein
MGGGVSLRFGLVYTTDPERWRHIRRALRVLLLTWLLTGSVPPEPSTVHVRWCGEIDGGWIVMWQWGLTRVESLHATEQGAAVLEAVLRGVEERRE